MNTEEKLSLMTEGMTEVVTPDEAKELLTRGGELKAYWGIEPSGLFHIGQALVGARKVRQLAELGFTVNILLADWHALINDKLDGSFESIQTCGRYLEGCLKGLGADSSNIHYVVGSDLVDQKEYWEKVVRISKASTVARIKRAMTIMGRSEDEADADASKLIYPAMQAADIFHQDLDLAIGGMDQRHAHMLARDVAPKLGYKKPVAMHWPLLMGLQGGGRMDAAESKMSKSNPDSAVFLHDKPDVVAGKLKKAFCPQGQVEDNPVLEHVRLVIFPELGRLDITRPEKFGGDLHFTTYKELAEAFGTGKLHPMDLKSAVASHISEILVPVQKYLDENPDNFNKLLGIIGARK
ncbi:MAG: tyrosine--tRNA ligase [Candidatus Thermoplasmatota archaeon]|nr:tyrosine--tRNA ligase [Euryarchaeota archaeon]MBU4032317.1 tyrosine--tRNA ligase [Candidatus Thermoplasmatota archaeon]MBU4070934.1 tyrosine--tRNA ligase [Candidatus Thermoplasmatota archaeon]MBU4144320.1 tyrosine--tRNA ligase [Candidatus Thermoplasmatota archaeon]MBU4592590.1 tyrosine--tRNA ligase [Candidatus Thermoplasmatota archaeon]